MHRQYSGVFTWIGDKTATALIAESESIENLLSNIGQAKKPKLRRGAAESRDIARLSRELATIITDCPIEINLNEYKRKEPDNAPLSAFFANWNLHGS